MLTKRIQVKATLPDGTPKFDDATLFVTIEDTSQVDAGARILYRKAQKGIAYDGTPLSFDVDGSTSQNTGSHNLRMHLSKDGDDSQFKSGDFITTQSYPIDDTTTTVNVHLQAV